VQKALREWWKDGRQMSDPLKYSPDWWEERVAKLADQTGRRGLKGSESDERNIQALVLQWALEELEWCEDSGLYESTVLEMWRGWLVDRRGRGLIADQEMVEQMVTPTRLLELFREVLARAGVEPEWEVHGQVYPHTRGTEAALERQQRQYIAKQRVQ
jgi:hypothetical protein